MHFFRPANVMKLCEIVRAEKDRAGCAGHRGGGRAQDRQGAGGGRRLRRLRRQPHAGAARQAGREAAVRRRAAAAGRRRRHQVRHADGPVRDGRSRRPRHRLALAQGPRHQVGDRRRAVRSRPLRPEDRQGLLQIRGRLARAAARSGSREADRRNAAAARPQAPRGQRRGDPRAHDVSDDQRGRAHPREKASRRGRATST